MFRPTPGLTPAQKKRRARDLNIALALGQRGASVRTVADLFGVSKSVVGDVRTRFFGTGPGCDGAAPLMAVAG